MAWALVPVGRLRRHGRASGSRSAGRGCAARSRSRPRSPCRSTVARAPGDPAAHVRRDPRHAARPGPDAAAAAARARSCRARTRGRPTRRSRGWRPRRRRSTGSTSSRRRAPRRSRCGGCASSTATRFAVCVAVLGGGELPEDGRRELREYGAMRRELIAVERASLLALRNDGPRAAATSCARIERDLDLDEARIRASVSAASVPADDRARRSRAHGATGWRRSPSRAAGCSTPGSPTPRLGGARRASPGRACSARTSARTSSPPRPGRRAPRRAHRRRADGDRARSPSRPPTRTTPTCACTCSRTA